MRRRHTLALPALLLAPRAVRAQELPAGPFRLVVGFAAGGSIDTLARMLARRFAEATGRSWIVENRSGAGGTIGAASVARAPGDGTTLLLGESGSIAISPAIQPALGYDPLRDLPPVTLLATQAVALVTNARGPASIPELVERARARPGAIRNGTAGVGNPTHLFGVDLARRLGIEIEHVHYRAGGGAAAVALLNDEVQIAFPGVAGAVRQIQAGQYRPLGVGDAQPIEELPGVPPVAQFAPGFSAAFWFGLHAPAATPPATVAALNAALVPALRDPALLSVLATGGYRVATGSPEAYAAFVREETAKLGDLARAAGVRPE
jgi:tripartite-type tricarboxylate transporter receptor subunit TctC